MAGSERNQTQKMLNRGVARKIGQNAAAELLGLREPPGLQGLGGLLVECGGGGDLDFGRIATPWVAAHAFTPAVIGGRTRYEKIGGSSSQVACSGCCVRLLRPWPELRMSVP